MDEALSQAPSDRKKTFLTVGTATVFLTLLVIGITSFLNRSRLVSPLSEETGDVRIIFVSPEASTTVAASLEPSVTPTASPKSSPKATPKATPSASPASPSPSNSPTSSPSPSASPS